MSGKLSRFVGAIGVGVAILQASPAGAQIWVGQIAGQIVAQQAAAAREKACLAGAPPDANAVPKITAKVDAQMAAFFTLTSKSNAAQIGKVFALNRKGVTFHDEKAAVAPLELGARLDGPKPTLTKTSAVIGGDMLSARMIWTAPGSDGGPSKAYAVDFVDTGGGFWGNSWRVWHMAVLPADQAPSAPGAYCHLDPDQAF